MVTGDEGYDADSIRAHIRGQGAVPNIPNRSNRKTKYHRWTKALYRERNRIKRFFNSLKQFRRIATATTSSAPTSFTKLTSMRNLAPINRAHGLSPSPGVPKHWDG